MIWYELAYVAGVTHALNSVADGLRLPLEFSASPRQPLVPLSDPPADDSEIQVLFHDIRSFYAVEHVPAVFRWMARDRGFLQSYWEATREAFMDRTLDRLTKEVLAFAASMTAKSDYGVDFHLRELDRLTKEILAFAASMTAKSDYGVDFHLREARRLGLSDQGLTEAVEVVQLFNTVTKIADTLGLQPDFPARPVGPSSA